MKARTGLRIIAAAAVALTVAGCETGTTPKQLNNVIRFAFAPDPVWDLMKQSGTIKKWEAENHARIQTSTTWDEFTFFAGGHGDIVSMSSQETPVLEAETKIKTVTFGKYNYQHVPMLRRAADPYETLADVPKGSKICVSGPTSNSAFWGVAAKELHGLDYRVGGGDFKLVVNDHYVNPTNLLRRDCEVAAILPEASVAHLRKGELELMYGGRMPFQLYNDFAPVKDGKLHMSSNNFVATEQWYNSHQDLAVKFLELWQTGIEMWRSQKAQTITRFPQHFSVKEDEDIKYMTDFVNSDKDWFVDNVFLDEQWIKSETAVWSLMSRLHPKNPNYLAPNAPKPRFVVLKPSK